MSCSQLSEDQLSEQQLSDEELHLYSRHILLEDWDLDAQQAIKNSRILIVGAGGIGCTSAELLARAGVGEIHIIDFDQIETSNLQRQIAFTPQDIGQAKALVLASHLTQINPHIKVQAICQKLDATLLATLATHYDLVLDGCDNFATRYLVNQFCVQHQIPLLSAAAIGLEGQLMFVEQQPCYQCIFPDQDAADERRCANSGVLTTTPVIMASLQAHHALLYLGLKQTPLHNKLLIWNGQTMQQRMLNLHADEDCPCCNL